MAGNSKYETHRWAETPTTNKKRKQNVFLTLRIHWIQRVKPVATLIAFLLMNACDEDGVSDDSTTEIIDDISMPSSPKWSPEEFQSAKFCGSCHEQHYKDWSTSTHAYATKDPVWRALVERLQEEKNGKADRFCAQCHSTIGTRAGEFDPNFKFENLSLIASEGVTCAGCHQITSVNRIFNAGHTIEPNAPMRGPIMNPAPGSPHVSLGDPVFDTSEFCGSCHDVKAPNELMLEEVYAEWSLSPSAMVGENCQHCHMPTYNGKAAEKKDVPIRDLHSHRFVGVSTPLSPDFITDIAEKQRHQAEALSMLQKSAEVTIKSPEVVPFGKYISLEVMVKNEVGGHSFPTGSAFNRQLWLEVIATNSSGTPIFHTGYFDANSDLDVAGDLFLTRFDAKLIDSQGNMTMFPWEAVHVNNKALKPGEMRSTKFMIPTYFENGNIWVRGPVTIQATLKFRQMPPYMLRELGLDHLLPELYTLEVAGAQTQVTVEGN